MPAPIITLLTDFGYQDPYVGIMKGVILGFCPEARIIDLTHGVAPYQIRQAAFLLHQSWRFFPQETIHVVVVDPGVGTSRRPLVVEAGGHRFIGPDNGVFSMLEGTEFREIVVAEPPESYTFHGRDVFAPAAARLATGALASQPVDDPVRLGFGTPCVLHIDRFGNVITSLQEAEEIRVGPVTIARHARTYGEVPAGELFLIRGSSGYLEIALNQGSAAERLGVGVGDALRVA